MIIDLILDRKDGQRYSARRFYGDVMDYRSTWPELSDPITEAMDYGEEADVKRELCRYIDSQGYNPDIKKYINSVNWLVDDGEEVPKDWWDNEFLNNKLLEIILN